MAVQRDNAELQSNISVGHGASAINVRKRDNLSTSQHQQELRLHRCEKRKEGRKANLEREHTRWLGDENHVVLEAGRLRGWGTAESQADE